MPLVPAGRARFVPASGWLGHLRPNVNLQPNPRGVIFRLSRGVIFGFPFTPIAVDGGFGPKTLGAVQALDEKIAESKKTDNP